MKVDREVHLKLNSLTNEEFIEILRQFTLKVDGWSFIDDQSKEYTLYIGFPSCVIQLLDKENANVFFCITFHSNKIYYISHIQTLPEIKKSSEYKGLSHEYNSFLERFVKDFRNFVRNQNKAKSMSISISKENIGLDDIISSSKVRKLFERYLSIFPNSFHPTDLERLDIFICAVSKYCRKNINLDYIRGYLIEDLNWSDEDAQRCYNRIKTGLEILKVNKKFHRLGS